MDSDSIWICDVHRRHQIMGYNWRESACRLPFGGKTFSVVIAFGTILVLFYLRENEGKGVYCLDLMDREEHYQFVESHRKFPFPGDCQYTDAVTVGHDVVHFMDFGQFGHCRVSLIHFIPRSLRRKYKIRHRLTASGYLRNYMCDESVFQYTPDCVIKGISKYLSALG